jgi:protease IV
MASSAFATLGRGIRRAWGWLDATRRFLLNLLLLLLLGGLLWLVFKPGPPALQDKTALVLAIDGAVVEQRAALSPRQRLLGMGQGQDNSQVALRDLVAAIDAGAKEPAISHALLMLDELQGASLPTLRELALALERFKAAGKPVVAWGSSFDQRQFFLAAHANELWLHPMGSVFVEGYGRQRSYYKELLDKAGISANVIRAGKYKSANENYAASGPSPETLEAEGALYNALWQSWTGSVEKARKLPAGDMMAAINGLPDNLAAVQGNAARWALQRKWVDALKTRDEMRAQLIDKGARDEANKETFRQIGWQALLARSKPRTTGDAVGVIVAQGLISDGRAGPGSVGGLSTAELVRQAREDDKIKAVVLRVDSPGGSAFGSELVRRELELTRKAGKPVVVSMGGLAASGGYWISMAADEVIADEATITGSIGVVGMLPTAEGAMDKLGIRTGGATTTWLAGAYDVKRALDPRFVQLVQAVIDGAYRDFTTLVATARKRTPEQIHEVAQGRVWSGKDALAKGLVDRMGGFADAVASAKKLVKLEGEPRLVYVETQPGRLQRLLDSLGLGEATAVWPEAVAAWAAGPAAAATPRALAREIAPELAWLAEMAERREPFAASAHCLCVAP